MLLVCGTADAQGILKSIGRSVGNSIRRSTEQAVDRAIDKAVDQAVDKAVDKAMDEISKEVDEASEGNAEVERPSREEPAQAKPAKEEPAADGWTCPKCGAKGQKGRYCEDCGTKDPALAAEVDAEEPFNPGAHSTWFCNDVGTVLSYETTDAEGKSTNVYDYEITGRERRGGKTTIKFEMAIPGLSSDPVECSVWSAEGWFHTDARTLMGQMGDDLSASGHAPILPENPSVGMKLKDCTVTLPGIATTADYSDVRLSKHEKISVQAGTFDAWCLEYTTVAKVAFIKNTTTTEQWMAKDVGVVKTVTKDRKGKVQTVTELIKIQKSK